jgi:hypothetical protein
MNFRNLMIVNAVTGILFGAGFIIAPGLLSSLFGIAATPASDFALRMYGAAVLGYGLLGWLVRWSTDRDLQKPVLTAVLVTDFGGFLAVLFAQLAGLMNALGWSIVVLLLLLSAAYAYGRFTA